MKDKDNSAEEENGSGGKEVLSMGTIRIDTNCAKELIKHFVTYKRSSYCIYLNTD